MSGSPMGGRVIYIPQTRSARDPWGWFIESTFAAFEKPELIRNRYPIIGARPARGNMGPAPILAHGLEVTYVRDSSYPFPDIQGGKACRWTAYKDGAYLEVEAGNTCTQQITEEIPAPKVRKGTEIRYQYGRWEKFSKREGWIAA